MKEAAGSGIEPDQPSLEAICSDVDAYYSACVARHGATPRGVDWSCEATQSLRFVQLMKLCDASAPFSLNDIGCGYGALVPFLAARFASCEIDYLGIDLSHAMISRARRRFAGPLRRFSVAAESPRVADYSVASGIMNVNVGYSRAAWESYVRAMLQRMFATSRRGFAVNFLQAAAHETLEGDPIDTRLYRTTPDDWAAYCEQAFAADVELIADYGMKEFTLLVRRAPDAAAVGGDSIPRTSVVRSFPSQAARHGAAVERAVDVLISSRGHASPARLERACALLRQHAPLHWVERPGVRPFWAVTRYADIVAMETRSGEFAAGPRTYLASEASEAVLQRVTGKPQLVRSLTEMDPPDHGVYRAILQGAFAPPALREIEVWLSQWAAEIIDRLAARGGRSDFAADVAMPFTFRVIGRMLGTPEADDIRLARLAQAFVGAEDSQRRLAETPGDTMRMAMLALRDYFEALAADRRARPRDDLATSIANAMPHGEAMPHYELISYFILLVTAGHDTTALALAGGLEALLAEPEQMARLRGQPELLDAAIEEMLRWTTPVRHFMRTAICDTEVGGRPIRAGDALALFFHSANRDEAVFADAGAFRIDRSPNPHIAFGRGPHICMGLQLARMQMRTLFAELLRRTERIELAGRVRRVQSQFMSGVSALPVRIVFQGSHNAAAESGLSASP
ncbi:MULTISPECIES: cytochrome P450 [unclassified Bradyrhizobium]|uniref:cytochrome P450 n=1 Tax=unclassified Bradyrhizobium TaxID=2631580 RepID=UPI0028EA05A1|nr:MULTISPECIES: cytochrome P450 [unclassified Bradyrhizobium]